ncbi:hypothetical protein [Kitasatospora kifunensis]|jgi:hypothetical protein|uniref:Uncharacterized protein n=1 Tax=Kitasatospora kifunensis TaxID=58351 RepID=A0A7W7R8F8_KITKI|nr:hypothetical protein [Kitasatospora kifunensis]MBB4927291.1 hypothetical protein [Kitasatospora kifunensis]
MSDDPRIGSPGTYEFSAPDGVLDVEWIGLDPMADTRARAHAQRVEGNSGGEYVITQIRRRAATGWQVVPLTTPSQV